jgi:hypothetical protein
MKKIFFFVLILGIFSALSLYSQKHDYVWIIGDDNQPNYTLRGGATLDFNYTPRKTYYNYRKLNMATSNASICDSLGRLVAYSNGCDIAGPDDQILINGEDINLGEIHTLQCDERDDGYTAGFQSALMLPHPNHPDFYYLFYKHVIFVRNKEGIIIDAAIDEMRYAHLYSKYDNKPTRRVLKKDVLLIRDTLSAGAIIATKHANGKDWWVVTVHLDGQDFYVMKLSEGGITDLNKQNIGIKTNRFGHSLGQLAFSPDGSKLYRTNTFDPVLVYDFDRETGRFTGFDTISYDYGSTPVGEIGCAVSPNGRFLYLAARMNIWQFDLQAADISASQTLVCEWVQQYVSTIPTLFTRLQLGPDCKIYGLGGGDTKYYHVIHNPDNKGMDCNAELNGLLLPTPSGASIPSFPNFRLGPLGSPGLPCSPVVSTSGPVATPLPLLSVFPNPARERLTVTVNQTGTGPLRWRLRDALGRLLKEVSINPSETDWAGINLDGVPSGACFWEATGIETGKIVGSGVVLVHGQD